MDLSVPLRSLSPGLEAEVLSVLTGAPDAWFNASQISRLATKGTRQGLTLALRRLGDHGLVLTEAGTNGPMYRLNQNHVLSPAVLVATTARAELLSRIRGALSDFAPAPMHGSIFGSFARGEAGAASDIDLLLIAPGSSAEQDGWEEHVDELRTAITSWTGNGADVLVFTEERLAELVESEEPIIEGWRQDNVHLLGARLGTLLRRAANA